MQTAIKRVLIVEDCPHATEWMETILWRAFPQCTTQKAVTLSEATALIDPELDLVTIDLGLPDGSGIELLRRFKKHAPCTLCVVSTVFCDDCNIIAALSAGASGYLLKAQPEELFSIQLVNLTHGIPAINPSIARRIMDHFRLTGPAEHNNDCLSKREKQVLALISRGLHNAEAAEVLKIAPHTVATHIKTIYRKLGICSRAEASWHATRMGL